MYERMVQQYQRALVSVPAECSRDAQALWYLGRRLHQFPQSENPFVVVLIDGDGMIVSAICY